MRQQNNPKILKGLISIVEVPYSLPMAQPNRSVFQKIICEIDFVDLGTKYDS